jgi:hypothetical protein
MRLRLASGAASVWLAMLPACYSTKPYEYEGSDWNATVVVYRSSSLDFGAITTYVGIDDAMIAKLGNNDYVEIQLPPGQHRLRAAANQYRLKATVFLDVADFDKVFYEARPNPMLVTVSTPVDAGAVSAAYEVLEHVPFVLERRTAGDFRAAVANLKRVELERHASN